MLIPELFIIFPLTKGKKCGILRVPSREGLREAERRAGDKKVQTKMKNPLDKIGKVWYNIRAVRESGER